MTLVRILGGPESSLERERLDEWRSSPAPTGRRPLCNAPFGVLVVRPDGDLRPCEYAGVSLGDAGVRSLASAWSGRELRAIRADLAGGAFRREVCGRCVRKLEAGLFPQAPPIRDYDAVAPVALGSPDALPQVLVVEVEEDGGFEPPDRFFEEVETWLPSLRRLEIAGDAPLRSAGVRRLLALARAGRAGPEVLLRAGSLGDLSEAGAALEGVARLRLLLRLDRAVDFGLLRTYAKFSRERSIPLEFSLLVGPSNWFDVVGLADLGEEVGARLRLGVEDPEGRRPLADLSLDEIGFVRLALGKDRERFDVSPPSAGLSLDAYDRFLAECRELHRERAEEALRTGSGAGGAGTRLCLPPTDHPRTRVETSTLALLLLLQRIPDAPSVRTWLHEVVSEDGFAAKARGRFSLRWIAFWGVGVFRDPSARAALRTVYAEEGARDRLLHEDRRETARLGLESTVGVWRGHLGLDRVAVRQPPFRVPESVPAPAGSPDVTVLVPSYRHEAYVEEALRSVLAQTYPRFRLLVVDDASPDATVERARRLNDPRIEVVVRDRNLGLGENVAAALSEVRTPYVALLNSDDLFHPERLERCRRALEGHPSAVLAATGVFLVDARGGALSPETTVPLLDGEEIAGWVSWYAAARQDAAESGGLLGPLLQHNFLATSSNIFCRTDYLRSQADRIRRLKYCLDWALFLEAAAGDALLHLPENLLAYRLHATNTVWFREAERWRYVLEVNRVLASALRRLLATGEGRPGGVERVIEGVVENLVRRVGHNEEADGFALFLDAFLRDVDLEEEAARSPRVRELLGELEHHASERKQAGYLQASIGPEADALLSVRWQVPYLRVLHSVAEVAQDEAGFLRGTVAYLRREKDRLAEEIGASARTGDDAGRRHEVLETEIGQVLQRLAALESEKSSLEEERHALVAERPLLEREIADLEARIVSLDGEVAQARRGKEEATKERAVVERSLAEERESRREEEQRRAEEARRRTEEEERRAEEARRRTEEEQRRRAEAERRRGEEERRHREEVEALKRTREWRTGDLVWNRLRLAGASRRGKKHLRHYLDRRNRLLLSLRRAGARVIGRRRAVVASCWSFPIHYHTFVYEEMQELRRAGLRVNVFCWQLNPRRELHPAFRPLWRNRVVLQADWFIHQRDLAHFRRTRPERVETFLEKVAAETGWTRDEVLAHWVVLGGFTFARYLELAGADYLHSYFFYDQSFMAMQAAYLLGIPRGITAYADHMLNDYPLKCVRLQLELADLVVATSRRIRDEVSALGGGRFDEKILVKPNGVDLGRFPYADPARFARENGVPELVAVNRIEPKKGLEVLAEAMHRLVERGVPARLNIVGAFDPYNPSSRAYGEAVEARVKELGLGDRVVFHGAKRQPEVAAILARSRVFVAPYVEVSSGDKDGIPTALLEAMATGLPVVATDAGSIPEVVRDGVQGLTVPQRDPERLAEAIERLLRDPSLCASLGEAGRRRVEADYNIRVTEGVLHRRIGALLERRR
ncbi:MAG TPA: glycosyltransferase [Planctomycetota bacterium]|nr:glycosyltransferase [Planctomycetota bacterium]